MEKTLGELAALVGGELRGPADLVIRGLAPVDRATPEELTFIAHPRFARLGETTQAGAVLVAPQWSNLNKPLIVVEHPYLAYARLAAVFARPRPRWAGVSPLAWLGEDVDLGEDVAVAPFAFIGDRVRLGDRVTVMPGCYVGQDTVIGPDTYISPNVTILERCQIGARVLIHSGAVIGADGFGFVPTPKGQVKIPQLGTVVIEDEVEIGANVTIDRGALGETRIGTGVKIDNLVQLAHNVTVGEHTVMAAQAGVAGSTKVGAWVAVGGQAGLTGHIEVGDRVQVGAQAGVTHSVPPGEILLGSPAWPIKEARRVFACMHQLPEWHKRLKHLEQQVRWLTARLERETEP
jgi:UDP-3-O-[3-hydroxymyristoyl] glucosamine N-acyltransferase|uniref:UDP-3-O-acylglucosamine N-acyltransferase n=1 Tax=Desulfobacca acetoxidans TaxID=60893 RepID=A0A7C5AM20_9BACT